MEIMKTRFSKNECPCCGEHEWNCYLCRPVYNGNFSHAAVEAVLGWSRLVDKFDQVDYSDCRCVDECVYCGCMVT